MKVLYYNWVQFDNAARQGGGVNVYQYNVMDALKEDPGVELYFLSAGQKVNPFRHGAYVVKTENCFGNRCRSFEVVNSPILASAMVYMNPRAYREDAESEKILRNFIDKYGPFDVIHFQNIEGLSSNVFRLKGTYPITKFIYSVHNYFAVCTTGNLFHLSNKVRCVDCHGGQDCVVCDYTYDATLFYTDALMRYLFGRVPAGFFARAFRRFVRLFAPFINRRYGGRDTMVASDYVALRQHNVKLINEYVDMSLAVSERVRQIMIGYGVRQDKIVTSYIGTRVANAQVGHSVAKVDCLFTIAYFGYARADKGYFFMMDALAGLDAVTKSKLRVVLAIRGLDQEKAREQLSGVGEFVFYDGYTHDELPKLLGNVNLGLVPVIWEDNLPQVAIEFVANGVPVLCSSFGGPSELCSDERFKFDGGDAESFRRALCQFIDNPLLVNEYWKSHKGLVTMADHVHELRRLYVE